MTARPAVRHTATNQTWPLTRLRCTSIGSCLHNAGHHAALLQKHAAVHALGCQHREADKERHKAAEACHSISLLE